MPEKELEEMNLIELGRLFPVKLAAYDPRWPELYRSEKERIVRTVGKQNIERVTHIGSTSVPGLIAKPTIDILLEARTNMVQEEIKRTFAELGYHFSSQSDKPPPHMMFMKGYSKNGYEGQAYHVHVRYPGDWDEPYFRDYLIRHPEAAAEYAALKDDLKRKYEHDREAYTEAKTDFIRKITQLARQERESGR